MKIYRVEHFETGYGPFKEDLSQLTGELYKTIINNVQDTHPTPYDDGMWCEDEEFCGCLSYNQLLHWFHEDDLIEVLEHGYAICEYDVPLNELKVGKSKTQVLFNMENFSHTREVFLC